VCQDGGQAMRSRSPLRPPAGIQRIRRRRVAHLVAVPLSSPSDCVVVPDGRPWITDPTGRDLDHRATPGNVWALDLATHSLEPMVDGVLFPNGIEFSTDARSLFVAESATGRVLRFSLGADGTWERDPWRVPDSMACRTVAVDADDHVWVACSFSGTVVRLSPDGDIRARLDFGTLATPTALCFAGSDV
jgi:gluconolactonase